MHVKVVAGPVEHFDVAHDVARAGGRVLGPGEAGGQAHGPQHHLELLILHVEEAVEFVVDVPLLGVTRTQAIAAGRHHVFGIIGPQLEPVGEAALVDEARLAEEELRNRVMLLDVVGHGRSASIRRDHSR